MAILSGIGPRVREPLRFFSMAHIAHIAHIAEWQHVELSTDSLPFCYMLVTTNLAMLVTTNFVSECLLTWLVSAY